MGHACSNSPGPAPIYNNTCSNSKGEVQQVPNVCILATLDPLREWIPALDPAPACKNISPEWSFHHIGDPDCLACEGCGYTAASPSSTCQIPGFKLFCKRDTFMGNPLECCLKDHNCSPGSNSCWSDQQHKQTCSPEHRNPLTDACLPLVDQYCSGSLPTDDPTSIEWLTRWEPDRNNPRSCYNIFLRRMKLNPDPNRCNLPAYPTKCDQSTTDLNAVGWAQNQQLIAKVIQKYQSQGFKIGVSPGQPGYNAFQEFLYSNVCCPYSGMCSSALHTACVTESSQRISLNPTTSKWCGCHLPIGEYQEYQRRYGIQPECTPMCNRADVIKQASRDLEPLKCQTNTCIIDGITVNLINSNVKDSVDFNQICGSCGSGVCSCIISDSSVSVINSTVGGSVVPALQMCGSSTCTQTNPGKYGPEKITVPCSNNPTNIYAEYDKLVQEQKAQNQRAGILWTLVVLGIILILIVLLFWWLY